ncbi:pleiotrophin-like protein isoform X1 [Bombyx mori]|uniref:pleiotrophin-like protein isoform X1 n=1 Tax=Bombyx mori TaxID=7091 RepID=UPI002ED1F50C
MELKYWWWMMAGLALLSVAVVAADGEVWEENDHEVLIRSARGAKNREACRYVRGAWSECDSKTNIRSRKLTLKKGDPANCEVVKTIQKKCKRTCRYEKSSWSECSINGEMSRTDKLKSNSDSTCDQSRRKTRKCNKNKQVKLAKDKGTVKKKLH